MVISSISTYQKLLGCVNVRGDKMIINLKGKTVGAIHSARLDLQRKYKRSLTLDETIQLLTEEK